MRHNLRPRIRFLYCYFSYFINKRLLQLHHLFTELKISVMVCRRDSKDAKCYEAIAAQVGQFGEHVVVC